MIQRHYFFLNLCERASIRDNIAHLLSIRLFVSLATVGKGSDYSGVVACYNAPTRRDGTTPHSVVKATRELK
jgi:hypothetical protein